MLYLLCHVVTCAAWQVADDEDEDIEHGKMHDDMWALDLTKYTVSGGTALGPGAWGGRGVPGEGHSPHGVLHNTRLPAHTLEC